jgi:hypothetical protein
MHGQITEAFGDGTYTFRLSVGQWFELQEKTGAGPLQLYTRLLDRSGRLEDPPETVRPRLSGGGASPADALKLVARYVDDRPMIETIPLALGIITASLFPPKRAREKPRAGEKEAAEGSPTSPPSTATVQ